MPQSYVLDGLAAEVANAFADACSMLSRAGARIIDLPLGELSEMPVGLMIVGEHGGDRHLLGSG